MCRQQAQLIDTTTVRIATKNPAATIVRAYRATIAGIAGHQGFMLEKDNGKNCVVNG
jgi:hypothetical protein